MTNDVDTTRWSLPGGTELPRDELKVQMEVYAETILLRGFENDSAWVRTVSADEIANVFTQHLGFSSGLLPQEALWWGQGETGQVVGLWRPPQVWPVALQREAFKPPARLRLPMPGLVFVCSPGRAPWAYAALERPTDPEQQLFRIPAFNVFRDGGSAPEATGSPRRWDRYRSPSSSPSSRLPETPTTARRSTPTTCTHYGRSSMERLHTRLRTLLPSARWPTSWRSPKGDGATASDGQPQRDLLLHGPVENVSAPSPVGYLVNHTAGLTGVQGIGYDYVLGSGGVYVQSRSAHLVARVLATPCYVRGLAPVAEKVQLSHGPIPARLFEVGLRWFQDAPDTERLFAVGWDGYAYRLVVPTQAGTASSLTYLPPAGVVAEFHSHGSSRAFFSATDDRDEQGFRIYGVAGRLDIPKPELSLRVGVYGHFAPVGWPQVFGGPDPGLRLMGEGPESTRDTNTRTRR